MKAPAPALGRIWVVRSRELGNPIRLRRKPITGSQSLPWFSDLPSSCATEAGVDAARNCATKWWLDPCHEGISDVSALEVRRHQFPTSQRRVDEFDLEGAKRPVGGDNRNLVMTTLTETPRPAH